MPDHVQRTAGDRQHYNITLAALTFAGIAFALQQTLIIPALPTLQAEFHTTTAWATWLLTAFLLVASVATPIMGKLGDQYGKERMLLVSLGVFFAGSIAAIFAPNIWVLIACRGMQGVGAAVFPLSFAIIKDEFPRERVGVGVGVVSSVFAIGGAAGLVLSGVIVDHVSWRWLFGLGAVFVAAAILLVHRFVPESPIKTPARVDFVGALTLSAGLTALLLALTEGEAWGWGSWRIVLLFVLAAVMLPLWAWVETKVSEPMVDVRMLANRPILLTNLTGLFAGFAMFSSFVLIPNFVQTGRDLPPALDALVDYGFGVSASTTGLYLLPGALTGLVAGPLAGLMGKRWGWRVPTALGMVFAAAGAASLALWHDEPWHVIAANLVIGAGIPLTFAGMATIIVLTVRQQETGVATGMNTVMRTVGGVVGGQVGAAILTARTIEGAPVPIPAESAYTLAFAAAAGAGLLAAAFAWLATPPRRAGST